MFTVSQGPNRPSCDYNPESDKLGLVTIDDVKEKGKTLFNFSPEYLKLLVVRFFFHTNELSFEILHFHVFIYT